MAKIVVLGGGFAGIGAILTLLKKNPNLKVEITLIDRNSYHLFTPSLYEVATEEENQKNIAIPFGEIFKNKINLVKGSIKKIDTKGKKVLLGKDAFYNFDYLIIALGSEPAYFGIEGLEEYALPLKRLNDAVKIKEVIAKNINEKTENKKCVKVVIAGAGSCGTELAGELLNREEKLVSEGISPECIKLTIVQGSDRVLKELDKKASETAAKRLKEGGVDFLFGGHIQKVDGQKIYIDNGKAYDYDVLIWTGGVKASGVLVQSGFEVNKRGQVKVDENLRIIGFSNIFAVGDAACFIDPKTQKTAPGVAQVAQDQGKIAGENVYNSLEGKPLVKYRFRHFGYIVPVKGRFALARLKFFTTAGFLGWIIQQLVFLRYLLEILPITKAFAKWNKFEKELSRA
ncbi:NAD(P)/FAD-dependent oxidoreductase [Patescibacteria group bacterium]|nr:NAD(P)/FAD-dependent oxidoreductase [Patescibacteria group bacterium]